MLKRIGHIFFLTMVLAGCDDGSSTSQQTSRIADHSETLDDETIRCTAVNYNEVSDEAMMRHGIAGDSATGVLSCTASNNSTLEASYRVTGAASQAIEFREVLEESYPTWIGTYDDTAMLPVKFIITVYRQEQPEVTFEFDTKSS